MSDSSPLQPIDPNQLPRTHSSSSYTVHNQNLKKYINEIQPTIKLSRILSSIPHFSFFDELISFPIPKEKDAVGEENSIKLSQHDLFKINKILTDIDLYLGDIQMIFNNIKKVSKTVQNNLLDWYFEGKKDLFELLRNLDNIESIISQLLLIIETSSSESNVSPTLLRKFEQVNELLFDIKKNSLLLKKNSDISIHYKELIDEIIIHLVHEIEDCIKNVIKLKEFKISSPKRMLPQFNLGEIINKMKIDNYQNIGNYTFKSLKLPTFNEFDEKLYNDYLAIESKLNPLRISLDIVPVKIDEFNHLCVGSLFKKSREVVLNNYEILLDKWNLLMKEMAYMKSENIDVKWKEIFHYLIIQIERECDDLIDQLSIQPVVDGCQSLSITDEIGAKYKLCSNSITLIQKANKEKIVNDNQLITDFNANLLPKWHQVIDLISNDATFRPNHKSIPPPPSTIDIGELKSQPTTSGLRQFQTGSRNSSNSEKPISNGYGIDFNVNVDQMTVPLSIQKKDRIKNIQHDLKPSKKINVRDSLLSVFETMSLDNDGKSHGTSTTLVKSQNRDISFDYKSYFNIIINSSVRFKSKIPRINPNYIKSGHPIIIKVECANSKIPEINPTHPVFNSPFKKNGKFHIKSLNSSPIRKKTMSTSSIATVIGRPNSLLTEIKIPNLTYSKRLSYNSESSLSPVRHTRYPSISSLGSKFDDEYPSLKLNSSIQI